MVYLDFDRISYQPVRSGSGGICSGRFSRYRDKFFFSELDFRFSLFCTHELPVSRAPLQFHHCITCFSQVPWLDHVLSRMCRDEISFDLT